MGPWIRGQAAAKKRLNRAGPIKFELRHSSRAGIHSSYRNEFASEQGNRRGLPQSPAATGREKVEKSRDNAIFDSRQCMQTLGAVPRRFSLSAVFPTSRSSVAIDS